MPRTDCSHELTIGKSSHLGGLAISQQITISKKIKQRLKLVKGRRRAFEEGPREVSNRSAAGIGDLTVLEELDAVDG